MYIDLFASGGAGLGLAVVGDPAGSRLILHILLPKHFILRCDYCVPSSRLWTESCSTSQCGCRDPLLCSSVDLPNDLWVWPKSCVPWSTVNRDRRLQHCGCRRHGKYEQGKASEETVFTDLLQISSCPFHSRVNWCISELESNSKQMNKKMDSVLSPTWKLFSTWMGNQGWRKSLLTSVIRTK